MSQEKTQINKQQEEQLNPLDEIATLILKKKATAELVLKFADEEVQRFIRACGFKNIFDYDARIVATETARVVFDVVDDDIYALVFNDEIREGKIGNYYVALKLHFSDPQYARKTVFVIAFSTNPTFARNTVFSYKASP